VILRILSHDNYKEEEMKIDWMFYAEVALVQLFLKLAGYFLYLVYRLVWRRASDTASTATSGGSTTTGGSEATGNCSSRASAATLATQAATDSDSAMIRLESKLSVA